MVRSIQLRVSEKTVDAINIAIQIGYAKNLADFGEKAVISKLEELGIFHEKIRQVLEKE